MKISIIGGGNMGGAIARGLSQSSIVAPSEITVSNRGEEKLNELKSFNPSIHTTTDNKEAVKDADVIILAVKPWILDSVAYDIREVLDFPRQIIVSVVAGITLERLSELFSSEDAAPAIFRVIPNTAVSIRQSMTLISLQCRTGTNRLYSVSIRQPREKPSHRRESDDSRDSALLLRNSFCHALYESGHRRWNRDGNLSQRCGFTRRTNGQRCSGIIID